jgi:hypothetical protein
LNKVLFCCFSILLMFFGGVDLVLTSLISSAH